MLCTFALVGLGGCCKSDNQKVDDAEANFSVNVARNAAENRQQVGQC